MPSWASQPGSIGKAPKNPLKRNAKTSAKPEVTSETALDADSGRTLQDAHSSETDSLLTRYRMQEGDVGFTAAEIETRLKAETADLTKDEERMLDGLLFDGFYEETFRVGKRATFTLRTVGARAMHSTSIVLTKATVDDPVLKGRLTTAIESAITVARMLVEFNGRRACDFDTQREFESTVALEARLEFVMDLPLAVVNAIGDRSNAFTNRIREAVKRDTSNFS